jgi:hypothetical protein
VHFTVPLICAVSNGTSGADGSSAVIVLAKHVISPGAPSRPITGQFTLYVHITPSGDALAAGHPTTTAITSKQLGIARHPATPVSCVRR